jgi:long-chain acyl-CoA synthetase
VRAQIGRKLRLLVCGGAALDPGVEERLLDLGWQVLTGYGLSETSPILTFNRRGASQIGSAGQPLAGTEIRISAPDADGVGEIEARGPGVFSGYLGDEAASTAAFTGDGWFRTGDLGCMDGDGYLHIVARGRETIVLSSGKKVFPEDVETAYASVPNVKEMAVLARGGDMVALVVPDFDALRVHGATRLLDVIRDALANRAGSLPGHFRLTGFAIAREPLPRTQIGKLRRHLLPDLYARISEARPAMQPPVFDPADRTLLSDPVAASVWEWLQARYRGTPINLDTSPQIDLGIDSLGWIDVTLSLQRSLRIELTDAAIARIVTLRDLLHEAVAAARSEVSATEFHPVAVRPPSDGPIVAALHYLFFILIRCLMRLAYGVRSEGVGRLPDEPFILCPNHTSFLDPFAVAAALPYRRVRRLRWGGWTGQLFGTPARRTFSRIVRVLPIDPDRAAASSLALATGVLSAGHGLVWFAEGERSRDGGLTRFRPGIGVLVERTHAPVVPVCIEGAFTAWPRGRTLPRFGRIRVRFGDPLKPDVILGDARDPDRHQKIANRVRDALERMSHREAA